MVGEHGSSQVDDAEEKVRVKRDMFGARDAEVGGLDEDRDDEDDKEDKAEEGMEDNSDVL